MLLLDAGPDLYRLAHLEAGIVAQRLHLCATALDLSSVGTSWFHDEEIRKLCGLLPTGWEVIYLCATGVVAGPGAAAAAPIPEDALPWRD